MAAEKAEAIVLRTTDWSETSRIATLWTRELGKVRVLAKGGRRLRSHFESALDLLNVCSIVFLRRSTGGLDLLTEARVARRFPRFRAELSVLYPAYYLAELLADWTEENDPHPALFDEVVATLEDLGGPSAIPLDQVGLRVMRFEMVFLREVGYRPVLATCASCRADLSAVVTPTGTVGARRERLTFSPAAGGVLCPRCQPSHREQRPLSPAGWGLLVALGQPGDDWHGPWEAAARGEARQVLGGYVSWLRGRRPRLLPYLSG
jgi:DNA repair protein RecO (recombination protein O)